MFELGHRHFAFIAGPQTLRSAVIRRDAFFEAVHAHDLRNCHVFQGNHRVDGAISAVQDLLSHARSTTAILCSNDLAAIGALSALQKADLRIPEDISVIGFDDISFAALAHPPLTTVSLPRSQLGTLAFEALEKISRSKRHRGTEYRINTHLTMRESTARVPRVEENSCFAADTHARTELLH